MKLPKIKKATWEKKFYPFAKYIVVEGEYNTYDACASLYEAIGCWLWHLRRKKK